jgi:hypothetical protein
VILRPASGSFYSRDVLNPDVVRYRGRYLLYFSGNATATQGGGWRTGVAVARHPLGPYRVNRHMKAPFLNGGTALQAGRLYQAATSIASGVGELFTSRNGLDWRRIAHVPNGAPDSWDRWRFDLSLASRGGGLELLFAGRAGSIGAELGGTRLVDGRWGRPRRILSRRPGAWDGLDLGEPVEFRAGRRYLLYSGLGTAGAPRNIGLAYRQRDGQWRRCGADPFIASGGPGYRKNAIDPEPLVVGNRLYVYFGGGRVPSLGADMNGVIVARAYSLSARR